jgi:hypothetical protein
MPTLTYTGSLKVVTCWCGMRSAIPQELYEAAHGPSHTTTYCPIGHAGVYKKNDYDRTKESLEQTKQNLAWYESALERTQQDLGATERSLAAQKGVATRLKKRIANGVCPCCNRQFQNVARHMAGQHPEFSADGD